MYSPNCGFYKAAAKGRRDFTGPLARRADMPRETALFRPPTPKRPVAPDAILVRLPPKRQAGARSQGRIPRPLNSCYKL